MYGFCDTALDHPNKSDDDSFYLSGTLRDGLRPPQGEVSNREDLYRPGA